MGTSVGAFGAGNSFDELNVPLDTQAGVKSPAQRKALALLGLGFTATLAEINILAGVVAGTVAASKAVVVDANKDISSFRHVTATDFTGAVIGLHTGNIRPTINPDLAAAGTNLATAAQLLEGAQVVTGADGTKGVKLPATPTAGTIVIVKGTTAGVLKVYPDAAATINAIGANGAMSLASGAIPAIFIAWTPTQWYTIPLLPS